jgi:hypothetical protein
MTTAAETIEQLMKEWLLAKAREGVAVETRRSIEDELVKILKVDATKDGTKTDTFGPYECKTTTRLTRKVDSDLLQEVAAEAGATEHLATLFRWKADIDMKAWKATSAEITNMLAKAITTTASRPSFSITMKPQE